VTDRFHCTCGKRFYWCRYCKLQHCSKCSPHPSRAQKYRSKVAIVQTRSGPKLIGLRQLAQLRGNSKGGTVTASRPNPGRFTPESGRKAAQKVWATRWRLSPFKSGVRLGRPRTNAPAVKRSPIQAIHSAHPVNGLWFDQKNRCWWLIEGDTHRRITERTALRRLGHLPRTRKHWQPENTDPIIRVTTGTLRANKRQRRK
jgi:hypothetical protein